MTVFDAIEGGYITGCQDDKGKIHLRMLKPLKSKNSRKLVNTLVCGLVRKLVLKDLRGVRDYMENLNLKKMNCGSCQRIIKLLEPV